MEPPAKRIRLSKPPNYDPDDDYREEDDTEAPDSSSQAEFEKDDNDGFEDEAEEEDDADPQEACDKPDADNLLAQERAKLDNRFQMAMAGIFSKYGRDFEGIGDEVDLETGDVIVDNGHLQNMRHEHDTGLDEDLEEGGVRLEDLVDGDDVGDDEGLALTDIPDGCWGQDYSVDAQQEKHILKGAGEAGLLDPSASINNPFMGFIARQPSPYTSAAFAPAEPTAPTVEATSDRPQAPDASEPATVASEPQSSSPAVQRRQPFGSYDGQGSIWAPGPRFKDRWPKITKFREMTRDLTPDASCNSPHVQSLNRSQEKAASLQDEKYNGHAQPNTWGTEEDISAYLVLSDPDGPDSFGTELRNNIKAAVERQSRKLAAKEQSRRTKSPNMGSPRQSQFRSEEPEGLKKDPDSPIDQAAANRRRSGRTRKKVDFLGLTSWAEATQDEALQDDVSNQLILELRSESPQAISEDEGSAEDDHDDQGLPTPPESGHDTSDGEQAKAPKPSKTDAVPDSQEISTSGSSPPPDHVTADIKVKYVLGDSTHDLSDDEDPVAFTTVQSAVLTKRNHGVEETSRENLTSPTTEITPVQYVATESTLALSDDELPVVFKKIELNSSKKQDRSADESEAELNATEGLQEALPSDTSPENAELDTTGRHELSGQMDLDSSDGQHINIRYVERPFESANAQSLQFEVALAISANETAASVEEAAHSHQTCETEAQSMLLQEKGNATQLPKAVEEGLPEVEQIVTPLGIPSGLAESSSANEPPESPKALTMETAQADQGIRSSGQQDSQELPELRKDISIGTKPLQGMKDAQKEAEEEPQQAAQVTPSDALDQPPPVMNSPQSPSVLLQSSIETAPPGLLSTEPKPPQPQTEGVPYTKPSPPPKESSLGPAPLQSEPESGATVKSSPLRRSSRNLTPSQPQSRTKCAEPAKASSTPKQTSSNLTPSRSQNKRQSSTKPSKTCSTRRSILTLVKDDDDDELLGQEDDAVVTLPKLLGTPSKLRVWKTSARTKEQLRTPTKKREREVFSPGSVVRTPGGTKKICGVDGFRCERDFCFSCLS